MNDLHLRAARERAQQIVARADRPRQRRSAEAGGSGARVRAAATMQIRKADATGTLDFHGVASVVERGYDMWDFWGPYTEVIDANAFTETLARADLDVPLVLAHDSLRRIARTTNGTLLLSQSDAGDLVGDAPALDERDADVAYIAPKINSGLIDEMSFAFRIEAGTWSPDYTQYRIEKVDLHRGDLAIVGYGANPYTSAGFRSASAPDLRAALLAAAIGERP